MFKYTMSDVYQFIAFDKTFEINQQLSTVDKTELNLWTTAWFEQAFESKNKHIVPLLIYHGCNPISYMINHMESFDYILQFIQDQKTLDSLLQNAAHSNCPIFRSKMKVLLDNGADPNAHGVLITLVNMWDMDGVGLLKRYGVDMESSAGKTARKMMQEIEKEDDAATDEIEDDFYLFG